jgi:hypothetical protein
MHLQTGFFRSAAVVNAAKYCQAMGLQQGFQPLDGFCKRIGTAQMSHSVFGHGGHADSPQDSWSLISP